MTQPMSIEEYGKILDREAQWEKDNPEPGSIDETIKRLEDELESIGHDIAAVEAELDDLRHAEDHVWVRLRKAQARKTEQEESE